jgi:hypothetical protein
MQKFDVPHRILHVTRRSNRVHKLRSTKLKQTTPQLGLVDSCAAKIDVALPIVFRQQFFPVFAEFAFTISLLNQKSNFEEEVILSS